MKRVRVWVGAAVTAGLLAGAAAAQEVLPPNHPPVPPAAGQGAGVATPAPVDGPLPSGHPPVAEGKAPPTAEQLLQQMDATPGLKEREKTFEMAAMIGRLYLHNGRPKDAQEYLAQAEARAEGLRKLLLAERKKLSATQRAGAETQACPLPEETLEARERVVRERLTGGDRAAAVACARVALAPVLEVMSQRGHAAFLAGDAKAALAAHARALEVDPAFEESLFSRSALLYETRGSDKKALLEARDGFRLLLERHPTGARAPMARAMLGATEEAIAAGGVPQRVAKRASERRERLAKELATVRPAGGSASAVAGGPAGAGAGPGAGAASGASAGGAPALSREVVEAVQKVERTPEFEAGLDKALADGEEYLARGRYEDALAEYRRVMPFRPQDGRTQAGLAWALSGLKKPMAERVWGVAVQSSPAAVEALGDVLQKKGDAQGAKTLWRKLSDSAPEYAGRSGLAKKLR
ncbi:MAG: hypothetical protein L0Y66_04665 [Myxococcaceae bacterium]|nr:hypothetical protein [Myxococcaceae bacterium]MCI0669021.1 hypothetical protein [Myxococcaceae bacterium]